MPSARSGQTRPLHCRFRGRQFPNMCGICGMFYPDRRERADRGVLAAMNGRIVHRGPDDDGFFVEGNVGLAMRRLSIIDVRTGHQPLSNEDDRLWIVYNGEIYNHRELRAQLEPKGHRYRTRSDTETIVHLYEQHGPDCVRHLRGMFAFAIWDDRQKQMFLARDRLGKKPLVYRLERERLLFASELKALLAVPGIPRRLCPQAVSEYLTYQYVPHPGAILQGFNKLPPAHWALYCDGKL